MLVSYPSLKNQLLDTVINLANLRKRILAGMLITGTITAGFSFAYYFSTLPSTDIKTTGPVSSKILDSKGNLLYEIHGETKRTPIKLDDISDNLINATVAIEDKHFWKHNGISIPAIARAAYVNYKNKSVDQGGSTITQQLVKNLLLTRERSLKRKINEATLALIIEARYTKEEILEMYLNSVPYGRNTYGAEAAALSYFNKSAKDLTLAESAYLAALPKAPSLYSPFGAKLSELNVRKDYILEQMKSLGMIKEEDLASAKETKVVFQTGKTGLAAPHFVKWIESSLVKQYGREYLETEGLLVYTSLDLELQQKAEQIIKEGVAANEKRYGAFNASLVAIEPATGAIIAMVGSKDYFASPMPEGCRPGVNCLFDPKLNASLALRQPGSSFKPYTYATAFTQQFGYSPATPILDKAKNFSTPGFKPYIPKNYDNKERGLINIRKALAGSLNIPAVRTLEMVGVDSVINTVRNFGITSPMENCGLSLTLGACEVSLLEHTAGFTVLANNGQKIPLQPIIKIVDKKGNEWRPVQTEAKQVIEPQAAYEVVSIMTDNDARSFVFGKKSPLVLPDRVVAAKTGTTQDFKDGWTLGFTPQLTVGVWVGNNNGQLLKKKADGVFVAAPMWNKFMIEAHRDLPAVAFTVPSGMQEVKLSRKSGKLATEHTIDPVVELIADYAVPKQRDPYRPPPPPTPEDTIIAVAPIKQENIVVAPNTTP